MNGALGEVAGHTPATVLDVPSVRPLPDAVRASLEAVKAAQAAARERARRETRQARAVVAGVAAAVAIGGLVAWPRVHRTKPQRAATVVPAPAPQPPALAPRQPAVVAAPGGTAADERGAAAIPDPALFTACQDSYQDKRWRAASAACAAAFEARPDDAKLALRVAEATYARDDLTEAREWARRTLALDDKQADALAIIARSEQRTGHPEAAAQAFRSYLQLAPHGWHAAEARAALRKDRRGARPATVGAGQAPERHEDAAPRPQAATEAAATAPAAFIAPSPPSTGGP